MTLTPICYVPDGQAPVHAPPLPANYHDVRSTAARIETALSAAAPDLPQERALYRLADLNAALPDDARSLAYALAYLGARLREVDGSTVVDWPSAASRANADGRVLARIRERFPARVVVRDVQRVCNWAGSNSWQVRGRLERLTAAGFLVPHPDSCDPATVWMVAESTVM